MRAPVWKTMIAMVLDVVRNDVTSAATELASRAA